MKAFSFCPGDVKTGVTDKDSKKKREDRETVDVALEGHNREQESEGGHRECVRQSPWRLAVLYGSQGS